MNIQITAGELIDRGRFDEYCAISGLSPWAINEGQMDRDEMISIDSETAKKLGLLDDYEY